MGKETKNTKKKTQSKTKVEQTKKETTKKDYSLGILIGFFIAVAIIAFNGLFIICSDNQPKKAQLLIEPVGFVENRYFDKIYDTYDDFLKDNSTLGTGSHLTDNDYFSMDISPLIICAIQKGHIVSLHSEKDGSHYYILDDNKKFPCNENRQKNSDYGYNAIGFHNMHKLYFPDNSFVEELMKIQAIRDAELNLENKVIKEAKKHYSIDKEAEMRLRDFAEVGLIPDELNDCFNPEAKQKTLTSYNYNRPNLDSDLELHRKMVSDFAKEHNIVGTKFEIVKLSEDALEFKTHIYYLD